MDPVLEAVFQEYEQRAAVEAQLMRSLPSSEVDARIDEFLICIGPETGRVMHSLVTGLGAKTIVELGASYGYSTLWFADAARRTGGKVHSFELSQSKVDYASARLQRTGLDRYVEFHVGSALDLLPQLAGSIDFVLIDLWKNLYSPCFELLYPKLTQGALVLADNMTHPESARPHAQRYQQLVRSKGDMDSVLLPVGNGVELSRKL